MIKKYALHVLAIASLASALVFAFPAATVQPGGSIQSAVNAAKAGDVITVAAGNYPESVVISKDGITVKCEQPLLCTAKRFDVWGSNNTVDGFKIVGGLSYGVDVRFSNNTIRNIDISDVQYDFGLPRGQGAAVGIAFFGTGHVFDNIYIHDIDQYHVDDLGYTEPHQDCFISWNVPARGGPGVNITISNVICDMPQYGDSYVSKIFSVAGGAHDWTIAHLVGLTPLQCIFQDGAYNINISYSTFVGAGHPTPQGCKFIKQGSTPAPHDNSITYSIFTNMSGTHAILETGNAVDSNHNCFWQVPTRPAEPGDVYANPLLLPDYHLAPESPCGDMGAFPLENIPLTSAPPTATKTVTPTSSKTPTPTITQTKTPMPSPTMGCVQAFDVWVCNFNPLP